MNYKIEVTETFKKDVKKLQKKFKLIKKDIVSLIETLRENPKQGLSLGEDYYKIRISNSSIPTGKSGDFRVIILLVIDEKIVLLRIYSKTDKENLTDEEFNNLFKLYKGNK